jgi:hypothetical protein
MKTQRPYVKDSPIIYTLVYGCGLVIYLFLLRGGKLMGDKLKAERAEFSTLS